MTRLPQGECDMSAVDVLRAADMQNKHGGYFTTLVMTRTVHLLAENWS